LAKGKVIVKKDRCKGCELCISVCPKSVLAIDDVDVNANGYHAAKVVNEKDCIACANCGMICPDGAISVYKEQ
jgi:2-oxoglutarate ferredoxin oxidoreductase subunit delta